LENVGSPLRRVPCPAHNNGIKSDGKKPPYAERWAHEKNE